MMNRPPVAYLALAGGAALGLAAGVFAQRRRKHDVTGRVVLITGASRGLGLALAHEFGKRGCRLAICARSAEPLDAAARQLRTEGYPVFASLCDVSDEAQVQTLAQRIRDRWGRIDILINNAGEILVAPFESTSNEDFERAMNVMFWGPLYTIRAVVAEMKERGEGRIANITSIGGKVSVPHLVAYSCAKFAAVALSEGLRAELGRTGVKVTTVAPGLMRTGSYVNARFAGQSDKEAAWFGLAASLPLVSMSPERAAAQVAAAICRGDSEVILTPQASGLARLNGAFPGRVPSLLSWINRLLPDVPAESDDPESGRQLFRERGPIFNFFTAAGRAAGRRLNQPAV